MRILRLLSSIKVEKLLWLGFLLGRWWNKLSERPIQSRFRRLWQDCCRLSYFVLFLDSCQTWGSLAIFVLRDILFRWFYFWRLQLREFWYFLVGYFFKMGRFVLWFVRCLREWNSYWYPRFRCSSILLVWGCYFDHRLRLSFLGYCRLIRWLEVLLVWEFGFIIILLRLHKMLG